MIMTEKEKFFVKKFNEMLMAAKDMETEGNVKTSFGVELSSSKTYLLERQQIHHEINGCFLKNKYRVED